MNIEEWMRQIISGLVHLHSRGIVHCDIQGELYCTSYTGVKIVLFSANNIMLSSVSKRVRICIVDFGNASLRCNDCTDCNETSEFNPSPDCDDDDNYCGDWQEGRKDDLRETAALTYQLVKAPMDPDDSRKHILGEDCSGVESKDIEAEVQVTV